MSSIVIFNVFGHKNYGDAALLEAFCDVLKQHYGETPIGGIAFDPVSQKKWMPEIAWTERIGNAPKSAVLGRLLQSMILLTAFLISLSKVFLPLARFLPKMQRDAITSLRNAKIAFACPGGYLEDSNNAYLVNCVAILLAAKLARRVVLAPQSMGPVKGKLGRWFLRRAVNSVDHTFLRESESLAFVEELVGKSARLPKCSLSGDLAFWYTPKQHRDLYRERTRLGIKSGLKTMGLTVVDWGFLNTKDPHLAKEKYVAALGDLIQHVSRRGTHQIVLFNQVSADLPLSIRIGAQFPEVLIDTGERDSSTYLELIRECDVFIGTRFHSCIFALLTGVPTTAIAYLPKTSGIMRDLGLTDSVLDINDVTGAGLIDQFEIMCSHRQKISDSISEKIERYRIEHNQFVERLATMSSTDWAINS